MSNGGNPLNLTELKLRYVFYCFTVHAKQFTEKYAVLTYIFEVKVGSF